MTELKFSITVKSLLDFFPLSMLRSIISSVVSVLWTKNKFRFRNYASI